MKRRLVGLDYLKVLATLMVLALHVHIYRIDFVQSGKMINVVQYALRLISEGVPLFVITNGFLLFRKEAINVKKVYSKALLYFVLYLVFGTLTILIVNAEEKMTVNAFMAELLSISSGKPYTGSLWFIQSLIAIYLIFPPLHYLYKNNYPVFLSLLKVVLLFSVGLNTVNLIGEIFLRIDADKFSAFAGVTTAFENFDPFRISSFLLFFMLGAYVERNLDKLKAKLGKLWLASALCWAASVFYALTMSRMTIHLLEPDFCYGSVFMVIQVVTVFVTFLQIPEKNNLFEKAAGYISSCSLWIYFVHNILIFLLLTRLPFSSMSQRLIFLAAVFLISLIIASVIRPIEKALTARRGG